MLKKIFLFLSLSSLLFFATGISFLLKQNTPFTLNWNEKTSLSEVLNYFGDPIPYHKPAIADENKIKMGRELFTLGETIGPDGKKTDKQSQHFVCTDCHNTQKEDPDLRVSDPETRLDWCAKYHLPFLQGTTMYGTVNKVRWYNGDYYKKYGDLVKPANDSIEAAITLCSTMCSQGRGLEAWEMEAMIAYYWSLELKMGDLNLTENDWKTLREAGAKTGGNPGMVKWLKTFFLDGSPAKFGEEPADRKLGYQTGKAPDPEKGKLIYQLSCMKCHNPNGPSLTLSLDEGKLSRGLIKKNITKAGDLSIYHLIRIGTGEGPNHCTTLSCTISRAYMPSFPKERMSDQQVEDLRAYICSK